MDLSDLCKNLPIINDKDILSSWPEASESSALRLRYRYAMYCLEEQMVQLIRWFQQFHRAFRDHCQSNPAAPGMKSMQPITKALCTMPLPLDSYHDTVEKIVELTERIYPVLPKPQSVRDEWGSQELNIGIIGAGGILAGRLLRRLTDSNIPSVLEPPLVQQNFQTGSSRRNTNTGRRQSIRPNQPASPNKSSGAATRLYLSSRTDKHLDRYRPMGVHIFDANEAVAAKCQLLFVCCPEPQLRNVLDSIRPHMKRDKVLVLVGTSLPPPRIQSLLGDGNRCTTIPTGLNHEIIRRLADNSKHPAIFQDFFKSLGTALPVAYWNADKEEQTFERYAERMGELMVYLCLLAGLPDWEKVVCKGLGVQKLVANNVPTRLQWSEWISLTTKGSFLTIDWDAERERQANAAEARLDEEQERE